MKTSGSYNFQVLSVEVLIREAFEQIGVSPEKVVPNMLSSARRSINLILLDWMSKTTNLWTLETKLLALSPYQSSYALDLTVNDLVQASLRTSARMLGGVAAASSGNASFAFDSDPSTSCVQTAPDGNISYAYGSAQIITFFGVSSFTTQDYTLSLSIDPLGNGNSTVLLSLPKQTYEAKKTYWFNLPSPMLGLKYILTETGGATLNITEVYFNNQVTDLQLSNISRYDYYSYPQKSSYGRPSCYYLDKQSTPNVPVLNLWPVPDNYYGSSCLFFTYKKMMQDALGYGDTLELPAIFYPALTSELAYRLSIKYNPEVASLLKEDAAASFLYASKEDSESTPLSILPLFSSNWG